MVVLTATVVSGVYDPPNPVVERWISKPASLVERSVHVRVTWLAVGAMAFRPAGASGGVNERLNGAAPVHVKLAPVMVPLTVVPANR